MISFNSFLTRIPLGVIGGVLYSILTYKIVILFGLPAELALLIAAFVFLFYFGSRLLLLFSGIESPYYSKSGRVDPKGTQEMGSFYQTSQWVGKFYHYHDIALFVLLIAFCTSFLISLIFDWSAGQTAGHTFQRIFPI